jgi:hypothetical protein
MPLRDHFRLPLDKKRSWDELHGMWPAVITQVLNRILPETYFAGPGVHLASAFEVDIGTFQEPVYDPASDGDGGIAVAPAPPKISFAFEPRLQDQDVYEVRVYEDDRDRKFVAAIEIVSPSNKDREDHRDKFVSKCAQLLSAGVCVSIVDVVSTMNRNLCVELFDLIEGDAPAVDESHIYATTLRARMEGHRKMLDGWYHPLSIGGTLPTIPIWLNARRHVMLDLEATYEECCRTLRIR